MRNRFPLMPLCLLVAILALPVISSAQPDPRPDARRRGPTVVVSGEGQSKAAPDSATVRLGAMVQAGEAAEAQERVNQIMQRAIEAVRELDVEEEDIRTADLSLYPVYSERRPPRPMGGQQGHPGEDEPRVVGYRASNVLAVELEDPGRIGDVIDAAVEAGANQLQGVQFELHDDREARAGALREAVERAQQKARVLAEAAEVELGGLIEVRESGVNVRPPEPMYAGARMAAESAPTPVQPGQMTITANVTLVYRLGGSEDQPTTRRQQRD